MNEVVLASRRLTEESVRYKRLDKKCKAMLRVRGAPTIKSREMVCEVISVPTRISTATMGRVHAASSALPCCLRFRCLTDLSGRDGSPEVFHKPAVETRVCQNWPAALPVMTATPAKPIRGQMCLACVSYDKPLILLLWAEFDMLVAVAVLHAHMKVERRED
jgi:hypothetical protein